MIDKERKKSLDFERWVRRTSRQGKQFNPDSDRPRRGGAAQDRYRSRVLDLYAPYVPFKQRKKAKAPRFVAPRHFSLSENTDETLAFLRGLVSYARSARTPRLLIDHRGVIKMGLGADTALGVILKEISRECRHKRGYSMRGLHAKDPKVRKMMEEIGCVRVMTDKGLDDMWKVTVDMKPSANVFRYRNTSSLKVSGLTLDRKSEAARLFSDHIDSCLGAVGKALSPDGRSNLLQYFGEIVSNADEHSGSAEWVVCGYINLDDPDLIYRCTIISFGETFATTFENLPPNAYALKDVEEYVSAHQKGGFFSKSWREEDLVAVVALQGDISSKNVDENSTRGQGTVDFIEFFQSISAACVGHEVDAVMTLLTGRTKIHFDGRYQMSRSTIHGRKTIAFNSANDLALAPDSKAVRALEDESFPGVAISIAAPLAISVVEVPYGEERAN